MYWDVPTQVGVGYSRYEWTSIAHRPPCPLLPSLNKLISPFLILIDSFPNNAPSLPLVFIARRNILRRPLHHFL